MLAKLKPKLCRHCRTEFVPWRFGQVACSVACGIEVAKDNTRRKLAREKRAGRIAMRRRRDWVKLAQEAFNAYIRNRDENLSCVSCDAPPGESLAVTGGGWDCGHFRTVGAAPQHRFNPLNAAKQCKSCNSGVIRNANNRVLVAHDSERFTSVRARFRGELVRRIGASEVERLECDNAIHRHTVDELKAIIQTYRAKLRELRRAA